MLKIAIAAAALLWGVIGAVAAPCDDQFLDATHPTNTKEEAYFLCTTDFADLYSAQMKTPIWAAEHLSADRINQAGGSNRPKPGPFHEDRRLPQEVRSRLSDYHSASQTYDRGHMAPDGDMPDLEAKKSSFTLANMIPQAACNNEGVWEQIEATTRQLATTDGELYVVTGPIFDQIPPAMIGDDQVAVPTRIFKAIYDVSRKSAVVIVTRNVNDDQSFAVMSVADLTNVVGIDVFPSLSSSVKSTSMPFPELQPARFGCRIH